MKNNILILPLFLIILLHTQCVEQIKHFQIAVAAKSVDKTCPIKLDENTTIDSCYVISKGVIRYDVSSDIDITENKIAYTKSLQKLISQKALLSKKKDMRGLYRLGVTLEYAYSYQNGAFYTILLNPDEYYKDIKWDDDEVVFDKISELVNSLNKQHPLISEDGNIVQSYVYATYPRSITYVIQDNEFTKPAIFDTIVHKKINMNYMIDRTRKNILNTVLDNANITYRYIYYGKGKEYLFTLEYAPDDYRIDIDAEQKSLI